jgi:hypothetical protein
VGEVKTEKTHCQHYVDEYGNYHSKLVLGNDVLVEFSYFTGKAPRENWHIVVITTDGVYRLYIDGETTESFCDEYGFSEKLMRDLLEEVKTEAKRGRIREFKVNEKNIEKASEELRNFIEKLSQTYQYYSNIRST